MYLPIIRITKVDLPIKDLFPKEVNNLYQIVNNSLGTYRVPQESFKKRLHVCRLLIQGLYKTHCAISPIVSLAVPHASAAYSKINSDGYIGSYRVVIPIVKVLESLGWIEVKKGFRGEEALGEVTTLKPAGHLLEVFKNKGFNFQEMGLIKDPIIVRNYDFETKRKYKIPLPKSDKIRSMVAQVNKINKHLKSQAICLLIENNDFLRLAGEMAGNKQKNLYAYRQSAFNQRYLDFSKTQLRRIFSRSKTDLGGRLYCGWWQSIPKKYRIRVTINHLPTIEIDYSGLHIYMLYHLENMDMPMEDPYDIGLWSTDKEREIRRPAIKEIFNAMINDEYGEYIITKEQKTILGISRASQVKNKIIKAHSAIAHRIESGYGLRLQYLDSQLAIKVMLRLIEKNVTVLPVHDSFIVDIQHAADLKQTMLDVYEEQFGKSISMKSKFLFDQKHRDHKRVHPYPLKPDGSGDQQQMFKMMQESIHNQYVSSHHKCQPL